MRTRNLRGLLALLREQGVTHYRNGDIELTLGALRPQPVPVAQAKPEKRGAPQVLTPEQAEARRMMATAGLNADDADDLAASLGMGGLS